MNHNKFLESDIENEIDSFDMLVVFKEDSEGIMSEIKGIEEIELRLSETKSYFYIKESEFFNAVTVDLSMDNVQAVKKLAETPTEAIEKAVPIDIVVPSTASNIIKAVIEIANKKIAKEESYSIEYVPRSKYLENLDKMRDKVPDEVSQKLNIKFKDKNTDWIVLIEELGKNTGIAVCRPYEIFTQ